VKFAQDWSQEFAPKLTRTFDGKIHIDTRFSQLMGKPPLMVAGMTPTTVNEVFVSGSFLFLSFVFFLFFSFFFSYYSCKID